MTEDLLHQTREGAVAILTLNRPASMNALNVALLKALREAISEIAFDPSVRAVILTGAGEKAFCAGADLKERAGLSEVEVKRFIHLIRDTMTALENLSVPVIAAVNGLALGGGTELALACDIRVAAMGATLGLTETTLAIIPGAGGTQRLARLVGKGRAKDLIFTGRRIDALDAERYGLVEYVAPVGQGALALARELADGIVARTGPIAVAQAKFAINVGAEIDLASGLAVETKAYELTIPTADRTEALRAFAEKRPPRFEGR